MENSVNIVAFAGCEGFDIILYLARLLHKLGRKVLIADHSDSSAITQITPKIMGIDIKEDIVSYKGIDFTSKELDQEAIQAYDDILISCCRNSPRIRGLYLNRVIYITDLYLFHIRQIAQLEFYDDLQVEASLIIREVVNSRINAQDILPLLGKDIVQNQVHFIERSEGDYEQSLLISHGQAFDLRGISRKLRDWLLQEASAMVPEIGERRLKLAFKACRKRERTVA